MRKFTVKCIITKHIFVVIITILNLIWFLHCEKDITILIPEPTSLDTTSHNFAWQIDTIGTFNSILRDVAIINENDIWVVGEIHNEDTDRWNEDSTEWLPPYNAVHWDGIQWELERIYYFHNGSNFYRPIPSIYAFNNDDIWFGNFVYWNGNQYQSIQLNISFPSQANKIWGTSSNDIYIVGINGLIAHYNGNTWQKLESGTDLPIQDIWGTTTSNTEPQILAIASEVIDSPHPKLIQISPDYINNLFLPVYRSLHSVWFKSPQNIYLCGGGVYYSTKNGFEQVHDLLPIFFRRIRGTDLNNIWVVGDFGIAYHFNGNTWKQIPELWLSDGNYYGLAVKGNLVVMVGFKGRMAIIARSQKVDDRYVL